MSNTEDILGRLIETVKGKETTQGYTDAFGNVTYDLVTEQDY